MHSKIGKIKVVNISNTDGAEKEYWVILKSVKNLNS